MYHVRMSSSSFLKQANDLLDLVVESWKDRRAAIEGIDAASSLRVALTIGSLFHKATIECIACIQKGYIEGRDAIYCLSEISLVVTALPAAANTNCNAHSQSHPSSNAYSSNAYPSNSLYANLSIEDIFNYLFELGGSCVGPLLTTSSSTRSSELQTLTAPLDLIPAIMNAISAIKMSYNYNYKYTERVDIIRSLFMVDWDVRLLLPMSSTLCGKEYIVYSI